MKKILHVIAIIGFISININADWKEAFKNRFHLNLGPNYQELEVHENKCWAYDPVTKTKISYVEKVILLPDLDPTQIYTLRKIKLINDKFFIKKIPNNPEKMSPYKKYYLYQFLKNTSITSEYLEKKQYIQQKEKPNNHLYNRIFPISQPSELYPKKTEELFKKYGGGWE